MNLDDVLKYGHQTVMNAISGLDEADVWSAASAVTGRSGTSSRISPRTNWYCDDVLNTFLGKTTDAESR